MSISKIFQKTSELEYTAFSLDSSRMMNFNILPPSLASIAGKYHTFFYSLLHYNLLPPSLATIAGYWLWFLYLKYLKMESEASKEVERFLLSSESVDDDITFWWI